MCNAWNHPPGCNCGWGWGFCGLGGRAAPESRPTNNWIISDGASSSPHEFSSYTNPNARCPECGAQVFFYQSPSGGRVFFDSLGPPWPKHPCTDHLLTRRTTIFVQLRMVSTSVQPEWSNEGWRLLRPDRLFAINRDGVNNWVVVGDSPEGKVRLYLGKARLQPGC